MAKQTDSKYSITRQGIAPIGKLEYDGIPVSEWASRWRMTEEQAKRVLDIQQQVAKLNGELWGIVGGTAKEEEIAEAVLSEWEGYHDLGADALDNDTDKTRAVLTMREFVWEDHQEHIREQRKGGAPEEGCPLCEADLRATAEPAEGE